jgi:hypothetical protein
MVIRKALAGERWIVLGGGQQFPVRAEGEGYGGSGQGRAVVAVRGRTVSQELSFRPFSQTILRVPGLDPLPESPSPRHSPLVQHLDSII